MILNVVKCDMCDKIIDESPDGGAMDGFTDSTLRRYSRESRVAAWPNDLYHLCGYCVFRAKVAYVKRKEEK